MSTMDRVAGLESNNRLPALFLEQTTSLRRIIVKLPESFRLRTIQHHNRTTNINWRTLHKLFNTWMLQVVRFKYLPSLVTLINLINTANV
ncbi:hypothetical protein D3C76_1251020 [compost metagenome]